MTASHGRHEPNVKRINREILEAAEVDGNAILEIIDREPNLHVLNCCTAIHRLARHQAWRFCYDARFHKLEKALEDKVAECNNMELTNTLWAYATNGICGRSLVHFCCQLAGEKIHTFKPRDLAVSAWALAKMGFDGFNWMPVWAAGAGTMAGYSTRDLSNVIWAFGTMNYVPSATFLSAFARESVEKADHMSAQDIGNTLWGMATLKYRDVQVLTRICSTIIATLGAFDQQNTSITLWSLATLEYRNTSLIHMITRYATTKITTFVPQGLANIAWALAKWGFCQKQLLMAIAHESIRRHCAEFIPQHLSMISWAYATLEFPNRPLLTELCLAATKSMSQFSAQHMANLTWGMATLAHKDEVFLAAVSRQVLREVACFNPQEVANLVWAFALLTWKDPAVLRAMSLRAQEIIGEFIPQNLGNAAWSYTRLQVRDDKLLRAIAKQSAITISEFQGQDVVDLTEAMTIAPGGLQAVDPADWKIIDSCARGKYELIRALFDSKPFQQVENYREQVKQVEIMGLGYKYTTVLLSGYGFLEMDSEVYGKPVWDEAWVTEARQYFGHARNASDFTKDEQAQAGLLICRTACTFRFAIRGPDGAERAIAPQVVASGPPKEEKYGFFAAVLRHHRAGDGEFQALVAVAEACSALDSTVPSRCVGDLWIHVSEVCCLSCCGAMVQFKDLFPKVNLHVSFDLGRQTGTDWVRIDGSSFDVDVGDLNNPVAPDAAATLAHSDDVAQNAEMFRQSQNEVAQKKSPSAVFETHDDRTEGAVTPLLPSPASAAVPREVRLVVSTPKSPTRDDRLSRLTPAPHTSDDDSAVWNGSHEPSFGIRDVSNDRPSGVPNNFTCNASQELCVWNATEPQSTDATWTRGLLPQSDPVERATWRNGCTTGRGMPHVSEGASSSTLSSLSLWTATAGEIGVAEWQSAPSSSFPVNGIERIDESRGFVTWRQQHETSAPLWHVHVSHDAPDPERCSPHDDTWRVGMDFEGIRWRPAASPEDAACMSAGSATWKSLNEESSSEHSPGTAIWNSPRVQCAALPSSKDVTRKSFARGESASLSSSGGVTRTRLMQEDACVLPSTGSVMWKSSSQKEPGAFPPSDDVRWKPAKREEAASLPSSGNVTCETSSGRGYDVTPLPCQARWMSVTQGGSVSDPSGPNPNPHPNPNPNPNVARKSFTNQDSAVLCSSGSGKMWKSFEQQESAAPPFSGNVSWQSCIDMKSVAQSSGCSVSWNSSARGEFDASLSSEAVMWKTSQAASSALVPSQDAIGKFSAQDEPALWLSSGSATWTPSLRQEPSPQPSSTEEIISKSSSSAKVAALLLAQNVTWKSSTQEESTALPPLGRDGIQKSSCSGESAPLFSSGSATWRSASQTESTALPSPPDVTWKSSSPAESAPLFSSGSTTWRSASQTESTALPSLPDVTWKSSSPAESAPLFSSGSATWKSASQTESTELLSTRDVSLKSSSPAEAAPLFSSGSATWKLASHAESTALPSSRDVTWKSSSPAESAPLLSSESATWKPASYAEPTELSSSRDVTWKSLTQTEFATLFPLGSATWNSPLQAEFAEVRSSRGVTWKSLPPAEPSPLFSSGSATWKPSSKPGSTDLSSSRDITWKSSSPTQPAPLFSLGSATWKSASHAASSELPLSRNVACKSLS